MHESEKHRHTGAGALSESLIDRLKDKLKSIIAVVSALRVVSVPASVELVVVPVASSSPDAVLVAIEAASVAATVVLPAFDATVVSTAAKVVSGAAVEVVSESAGAVDVVSSAAPVEVVIVAGMLNDMHIFALQGIDVSTYFLMFRRDVIRCITYI